MKFKYIVLMILCLLVVGAGCEDSDNNFKKDPVPPTNPDPTDPTQPGAEVLAFPGAEGGGKDVTGGRGGQVLKVTSLADDNTKGTLRWAINQKGARYIVFDVSGTIFLKSGINITEGNLTIAGQTAPGDGICIAGYPVILKADNIILRFLRFRMGDDSGEEADALEGRNINNIIVDHCSVSWSTDECASFYDNTNFTMQWCLVSESLRLSSHSKGPHGYGAMWGGFNATFHHNLLAHHDSRTPRFCGGAHDEASIPTEYCNNVVYNWSQQGCYGGEQMYINIRNNYYKPGAATPSKSIDRIYGVGYDKAADGSYLWGKLYVNGNYFHNNGKVTADNWLGIHADELEDVTVLKSSIPFTSAVPTTLDNAQMAYEKVLASVGCSYRRDELDARIIEEVRNGTTTYYGLSEHNGDGNWGSGTYPRPGIIDTPTDIRPSDAGADWSPWPTLKSEEVPLDTDGDGMPDEWEIANGLDPNKNDSNGFDLHEGYENIEVYFNSLVEHIVEQETR